jgi:hypothetical protein
MRSWVQVLSAKMQQITLREWIPVLGISEAAVRGAKPKHSGPDISVEFATAAYRFGHDLVPDFMGKISTVSLFNAQKFYGVNTDGAHLPPRAYTCFCSCCLS